MTPSQIATTEDRLKWYATYHRSEYTAGLIQEANGILSSFGDLFTIPAEVIGAAGRLLLSWDEGDGLSIGIVFSRTERSLFISDSVGIQTRMISSLTISSRLIREARALLVTWRERR